MGKRGPSKGGGWSGKLRTAFLERPWLTPDEVKEDLEARSGKPGEPNWPVFSSAHYGQLRRELAAEGELRSLNEVRRIRKGPQYISYLGRELPEVYVPLKSKDAETLRTIFKHKDLPAQKLQGILEKKRLNISPTTLQLMLKALHRSGAIPYPIITVQKKPVVLSKEKLRLRRVMSPYARRRLASLLDKYEIKPALRRRIRTGFKHALDLAAARIDPARVRYPDTVSPLASYANLASTYLVNRAMSFELARKLKVPIRDAEKIVPVANAHLLGRRVRKNDLPRLQQFLRVKDRLPFKLSPSPNLNGQFKR